MNIDSVSALEKSISNDVKSKLLLKIYFDKIFHWRHYYCMLFLFVIVFLSITYYSTGTIKVLTLSNFRQMETTISDQLDIIDLQEDTKENFTCIKTKSLLNVVRTTVCLHDKDFISNLLRKEGIWEEHLLIKILKFLIQYPQMSFIDVGANIGNIHHVRSFFWEVCVGDRVLQTQYRPNP